MYSQYWNTAGVQRADYRRYTIVEGDKPLPVGYTYRRKRLRSAGEDDDEEARSCASRPNPEGCGGWLSLGELSHCGRPDEKEQLQRLCQRCHIMASQLNRQAAALADTTALKDPVYASFLFDKLQRLQWPRQGASVDGRCEVCSASFHQLRRVALCRALGFSRETPRSAASSAPPAAAASDSERPDELPVIKQRRSYDGKHGTEASWGWGGVKSNYLGGGGAKRLATVTPPTSSRHCLEGVWRVSCRQPERQQTRMMVSTSGGDHVTMKVTSPDGKPAAHSVATQTSQTPSAAATFFNRAAQKLSLSRRKKSRLTPLPPHGAAPGPLLHTGGFSGALQLSPPAVPPCLLRARSKAKDTPGKGKVRVMVRICSVNSSETSESMSFLKVDGRKKQLNLCQTSSGSQRRSTSSAPKTFTFDAIFTQEASQAEVCSGTVTEVIHSVVNGADGCIFAFGHANLGKTYTMIGRDCSPLGLGVAPTAISWLFKLIEERREKAGAAFSVRVSAVEISGREETLSDLLAGLLSSSGGGHQEAPCPAVSLQEDPVCGSQLQNQTELRAADAERAAFFLDAALAVRWSSRMPSDQEARRNSHFLFTLHVYQQPQDKSNKAAVSGRSRLHLLDLGSCETDISRTREGGGGRCLSLSALGNVVLALANGAEHVPYRDSKLTMLLSQSLGNINCRTTMIAHISDSPLNYMETLTTVQLASRIHHTRKKKSKYTSSSSGGETSCEEGPSRHPLHLRPFHPRTLVLDPHAPSLLSSDPDHSSSSEHSFDTIIYVGPGREAISDGELSEKEGPPFFVPIIPSLNKRRVKDAPGSDGDHFKCNTFAELQERLDCINGSEGPATFSTESNAAPVRAPIGATKLGDKNTNKPDPQQSRFPSASGVMDTSKRASGEKHSTSSCQSSLRFSQDLEPAVRPRLDLRGAVPKPSASPSLPRTSRTAGQSEVIGRTPPLGMCQQTSGSTGLVRTPHTHRCSVEVNTLQAALLLGRGLDRDSPRTTITMQRPMQLNSEDELVFTVAEELPVGPIPDNGRPSNIFSSSRDSGPVSIISSINDEYDAYTSQYGSGRTGAGCPGTSVTQSSNTQSADPDEIHSTQGRVQLRDKHLASENVSMATSMFDPLLPLKSSQNASRVSVQDRDIAVPNKPSFTKRPPSADSTKDATQRVNTVSTGIPRHAAHSSLPRKIKSSSTAHEDFNHSEPREGEFTSKPRRSSVSNNRLQTPKTHVWSSAERVVDGCEKSSRRKGDAVIKLPRLADGATNLATVSVPLSSESKQDHERTSASGTLQFSSLGRRSYDQKSSGISKCGSGSVFPPDVRPSCQEQKTALPPSALKARGHTGTSSFPKTSTWEEEQADCVSSRTSSLKVERTRTSSSPKKRGAKADSYRFCGSVASLDRRDSPNRIASKLRLSREDSGASLRANKANRSVSAGVSAPAAKLQVKGSSKVKAAFGGSKVRSPSSSPKPADNAGPGADLPSAGTTTALSWTVVKPGRGAIMATNRAVNRSANSRVSKLAASRQRAAGLTGSASGTSSVSSPIQSPYSKITAPRWLQQYSSILSGELPPAMGRNTLFYHSGGSSGYESMIRDSETTGSMSSAHDSMSESGMSSSDRSRWSKSPRKRGHGFLRRRLIPSALPNTSSLGRKEEGQWVDLKEPFEIKVYEIDDMERLQRRTESFQDVEQGLLYFNARLRMLEQRQQHIRELKMEHERLGAELEEAKRRLMLDANKWSSKFDVDQDLDQESQEYLEALAQATEDLEYCINLCRSRVMMETCFDIAVPTAASVPGGQQEVEV